MKKFLMILGVLVIGGGALAFAMEELTETKTYSWRYRITVEIETPEGIKSGSAVRQVDIAKKLITKEMVTDPNTNELKEKEYYKFDEWAFGEAVVVDLGEGGKVFTLINWSAYMDVHNAFGIKRYEDVVALPVESKAEFKSHKYPGHPKMVMFKDLNNPKTVTPVMMWSRKSKPGDDKQYYLDTDNFEKLFGEGVALKSIIIEITDDEVTSHIESVLPWVKDMRTNLDGTKATTSNTLPNVLHVGNFKRLSKEEGFKKYFRKGEGR